MGERIQFIEYDELKRQYPKLFEFLLVVKVHLNDKKRSIKPDPTGPNEWYRYGRSQALENCDVDQKLIVGVLSNGYKYSIDNHRTFVSSGGTAGYSIINVPNDVRYSIYYIQAILTSNILSGLLQYMVRFLEVDLLLVGQRFKRECLFLLLILMIQNRKKHMIRSV